MPAPRRTPCALQFAVHVEQPLRAAALVEVVDILGDDQKIPRPFGIKPCQRAMRRIGPHGRQRRPPRVVKALHQHRVAPERLRRRHILYAVPFPQPIGTAKRRHTAFGGNAGAGQDDDVANGHCRG